MNVNAAKLLLDAHCALDDGGLEEAAEALAALGLILLDGGLSEEDCVWYAMMRNEFFEHLRYMQDPDWDYSVISC